MGKRIAAIAFIFICTALAWAVLGSTIFMRTDGTGSSLYSRVGSIWGTAQEQGPAEVRYVWEEVQPMTTQENGKEVTKTVKQEMSRSVALDSTHVAADLHLDYRQKGLLWFSTYQVVFANESAFRNPTESAQTFEFRLPLPAKDAVYDSLAMSLDDQPLKFAIREGAVVARTTLAPGAKGILKTEYRSRGQKSWRYRISADEKQNGVSNGERVAQANDFHMVMHTDFSGFDFPDNSLSPTSKTEQGKGWELRWDYANLISGFDIALEMPEKLQPGPLAGEISYFAPVSLFFFFFLVFILATIRGIDLHPMNYFFLAAAFFAFHLLLAYLVDHVSIHLAFAISSVVSVLLVVTYLRLVVNFRFAFWNAGVAQFVYLVLFSYAFFFKGFTGLAVTIGSVLTLFVVMQMTGKIRWEEKFGKTAVAPAALRV